MHWTPNTSQETRIARAQMLQNIRAFFLQRNVLEVETPAFSQAGNTDPFIESFKFEKASMTPRYLHTSPEYPMKRLLAAGSGDIYQICKVWRQNESGNNHNPEFTMLEYYRVGFTSNQLLEEVSRLLFTLLPNIKKTINIKSYAELFLEKFSFDPHIANRDQLITVVEEYIPSLDTNSLDSQALLDALLTHCIEPDFDTESLTFVKDYPESQSALAKIQKNTNSTQNYSVAMRFEVYLGQLELGNGYQEETNSVRNQQILEQENQARWRMGLETITTDSHFLNACQSGIPESAGIAIGLDRVLMAITGEKSIQKVINFPWDKA